MTRSVIDRVHTWFTDATGVVESVHRAGVVGAVEGGGVDMGGRLVYVGTPRAVPPSSAVPGGLRQTVSITVFTTWWKENIINCITEIVS